MANENYSMAGGVAAFTPLAEIAEPLDYMDRTMYLGRANFPRTDSLKIGMAVLCDDEFMQVTALGPGTVAVKRGTGDTVPAQHVEGSLAWFISTQTVGSDSKEHSAGQTTAIKYSPYTTGGSMPVDGQEPDTVVYNWRFYRPYPPGAMRVRGQRWYEPQILSAENSQMRLTWAHRDRIIEADQLVDHDAGNIGPEPGTTYTIRIYNAQNDLKRTEVGIMAVTRDKRGNLLQPQWTYTWAQAMRDLGFTEPSEEDDMVDGRLTVFSTRDGFDSWQGYVIDFTINTQGHFLKVAQMAQMAANTPDDDGSPQPPMYGLYVGQFGEIAAQRPTAADEGGVVGADGMYVSQLAEGAGQETSFYTPLNRNLFETPYAIQLRQGISGETMLTTVVARPSDRLTDAHSIWTRYNWPVGTGVSHNYGETVPGAQFTPWVTTSEKVAQLTTEFTVLTSSYYDGVSLTSVQPGQCALIGAEIVRVEAVTENAITVSRGCLDTVPAPHAANTRMWFFEAAAGFDPTDYPLKMSGETLGAAVEVKMVPDVYGPDLNLLDVPTDRLLMARRVERPYPPGTVLVDGKRWFSGALAKADTSVMITWEHRNRLLQGPLVIDHLGPQYTPEDNQKYRLSITVSVRPKAPARPYTVTVREVIVDGTQFEYTWDMAKADGYRAGSLMGACGFATVGLVLETIRDGLTSWQNYVIPMRLPSFTCPPGQAPGGGQLPSTPGNGNGSVGGGTPGGSTGGDNNGDGPGDPIDNGGSGDNGSGPPGPPEVPPDWPDPIDPPPDPDPEDPNPQLAAHWDLNWDRHWDAYNKDNQGG